MHEGAYARSLLATMAGEHQFISFVDLDGSIAGYSEAPSVEEIEARAGIREELDNEGGVVFSTMRSPELCMDEDAFKASQKAGFKRLEPLCHIDTNKRRRYKALNTMLKFAHNLNPHCISNPGTGIWVRKTTAYHPDLSFFQRHRIANETWRTEVEQLLEVVDPDNAIRSTFSALENANNYGSEVDVGPLECRFELRCRKHSIEEGTKWTTFVRQRIYSVRKSGHQVALIARGIELIDESVPEYGRFQLYLVPRRLTKQGMCNHIFREVSRETKVPTHRFTVLNIGDRMPDLKAGLFVGHDARGFFVLAGGSPLTDYLIGKNRGKDFAGQSLASIVRRLNPIPGEKGFYTFHMFGMPRPRIVVIADEAFKGKTDAASIHAFLKRMRDWR